MNTKLKVKVKLKVFSIAIPKELSKVYWYWLKYGVLGLPVKIGKSFLKDPVIEGPWEAERLFTLISETILELFDHLGPIYGKAGQIALSRVPAQLFGIVEGLKLTRLYGDWPPLKFAEIEKILDKEIPRWHEELNVDPYPLGVASISQVHGALDKHGHKLVIKVIKPHAKKRLLETVSALEQLLSVVGNFALSKQSARIVREFQELCKGFKQELDLNHECQMIDRMYVKLQSRKQTLIKIPKTYEKWTAANVLTLQRFEGVALTDIASGKVKIDDSQKRKLARKMLKELLIQVFEVGLFHGDPHAGNLILLPDGSLGLFDWGLTGELLESDRHHIANLLKAVIALDLDKLIDAIVEMAQEKGQELKRSDVRRKLQSLIRLVKRNQERGQKATFRELVQACIECTNKMGVPVPSGLLMMAKSLVTIEGLAKGIDPQVNFSLVASPILLRAAKLNIFDMFRMTRTISKILQKSSK